jgi:hypothetical protein
LASLPFLAAAMRPAERFAWHGQIHTSAALPGQGLAPAVSEIETAGGDVIEPFGHGLFRFGHHSPTGTI